MKSPSLFANPCATMSGSQITPLDSAGFLVEDVLDLYHGRGAEDRVLTDADVEEDPDRWCSYATAPLLWTT